MTPAAIPLVPDGDEARRWIEDELSDPVYAQAQPTPIDRLARAVADGIDALFSGAGSGAWGPVIAVVAVIVLLAVVIGAFLLWGRPRAGARSAAPTAELFGVSEERSARQLRADAERAAARGEWDVAIATRFRALARALDERGVVSATPGTTVHGFARRAAVAFPASGAALEAAASLFDDVRYLRRPGTAAGYDSVSAIDDQLDAARSPVATA